MSPLDLLRFAATALGAHKVRTSLTVLGIAVGVAAVVLLTSLGEGGRLYIQEQFLALGSNLLVVIPGKTETTGGPPVFGGTTRKLTLQDAEAIRRRCPRVRRVAPLALGVAMVQRGPHVRQVTVLGSTPELREVRNLRVAIGRFLPEIDPRRGEPVCVIGRTVQRELFAGLNPLGETLRLGKWRFRVIGVLHKRGQSLGLDMDDVVVIPVATALHLFNQEGLFRILMQVGAFSEISTAERDVKAVMLEQHDREEDFTILTPGAVMSALASILGAMTTAVASIGAISLVVAGIGVMNVMLMAVSERTAEVGLMKALGARPAQILAVFLVEAVLLSSLGGAVGLALGFGGARLLTLMIEGLPAATPYWAAGAAAGVGLGAGLVFGVWPARRAARLEPVAALARGR